MLKRPRAANIVDALSSLINVICAPKGFLMDADIPMSVRAHVQPYPRLERFIDKLLAYDRDGEKGHCALATERQDERSIAWLKYRGILPEDFGKDPAGGPQRRGH